MTNTLEAARAYEKENTVPASQRPLFHLTAPVGWMNDPNGFSYYHGTYHLFYQYFPYADHWGPMHWGHSTTTDFIHWNMQPVALAPDSPSDCQGCFSGGAVTAPNGQHALLYTGCRWDESPMGNRNIRQRQCISLGDGKDYIKPDVGQDNVIIDSDSLPEGFSREDFRDPKVWQEPDGYHMIAASRAADGFGQILSFSSEDLVHWIFRGVIAHNNEAKYGIMWECPEAVYVDGREIYLVSGQDMHAIGREFFGGDHVFWFFGNDSGHFGEPVRHIQPHNLDYGFDFYATQTIHAGDGRTILLAWMQNWDTNFKPASQKWNGQVTIPRELSVKENTLYQQPVRELKDFRKEIGSAEKWNVHGVQKRENVKGRILDIEIELSGTAYQEFTLHLAHDEEHDLLVTYNRGKQLMTVDRTLIGSIRDIPAVRSFPVHLTGAHSHSDDSLKFRIVLDKFSAEIFVNEGAQVFTATFYTPLSADDILFESDGETEVSFTAYRIDI